MKNSLAIALVLSVFPLASVMAAGAPPPPQQQAIPAPKILVLDRSAILGISKVGQDISRQIQGMSRQAKADLDARAKALQTQGQALSQQVAVLAPDVKAAKVKEFENKQAALQSDATRKEQALQYSALVAQQQVAKALDPILDDVMRQRGANMILDRSVILKGNVGSLDITQDVINRLNGKMSTLKVNLVSPPPGR
jgi:outer membrane protein